MDRCHDLIPAQAPPAPAVCAPLPARPNHGAADFPTEPGAAAEVLGADPLAAYFYPGLVQEPARTLREALFGAYLYDYADFEAMLGLAERAAQVELAISTDPTRAGQLRGLPASIAAGKAALAADLEPFELDVLLGADPRRVIGLVTGLFSHHAHTLAERLQERAAGDPVLTQRAERLIALVQGTEAGSLWQGGLDLTASGADALIDAGTDAAADIPMLEHRTETLPSPAGRRRSPSRPLVGHVSRHAPSSRIGHCVSSQGCLGGASADSVRVSDRCSRPTAWLLRTHLQDERRHRRGRAARRG